MSFVHTHVHSGYSALDGLPSIEEIAKAAAEQGCPALALTDHGVAAGAIELMKECRKVGIKPITGIEMYITNDPDGLPKEQRTRDNHHLTVWALNHTGYRNLLALSSHAHLHNFYYKPRIHKDVLAKHTEGLAASSGCLGGELASDLRNGLSGTKSVGVYSEIFGKERFFIELQDGASGEEQTRHNALALATGVRLGLRRIVTSDSHFLCKEDHRLHEVIMAIQLKKTLEEYRTGEEMRIPRTCYLRPPQEMERVAEECGDSKAARNTIDIAEMAEDYTDQVLNSCPRPDYDFKKEPDYKEFLSWCRSPA